ncbi:MAG: acetoin dehydrogenase [Deltaproteobacteria bacterium]|nr:MAG: acetoin dehydrogenase [Deltaproteobacteria bacterium]
MKHFSGKVAAITGAGSGIGQALAVALAAQGCHLAISDLALERLDETEALLNASGVTVSKHVVDVADREAIYAYADAVVETHGRVNLIFNNAGVSLVASFKDMSDADFNWMMNINFWGVVHGTRAFLPHLQASGDGHIVNISSLFGLLAVPTQSAYNAAKFAVRGYTEALRMELEMYDAPVSASSVHPGGIRTNIMADGRIATQTGLFKDREKAKRGFDKIAITTAAEAAEIILKGVRKNKRRILVGKDAVILDLVQRFFPQGYQKLVTKNARKTYLDRR